MSFTTPMTENDGKWLLEGKVDSKAGLSTTLKTADTYVDKNIKIDVSIDEAQFSAGAGAINATVSTTDTTYTSSTETPYPIVIAADANAGAVDVTVTKGGFATFGDKVTVAEIDAEQDTKTLYIKQGHLTGESETGITSESVKMTKGGTGDFIVKASAEGSVKVDVAGWLPVDASADASSTVSYAIQEASLANTGSADATEVTAPVLTSGGYLYINEGYIKDTKISLATLIPDDANITDENANLVYNTVKAYDKDGALIVGTMGDATLGAITAEDAAATVETVTVAADGSAFKVTGSADIEGTTSVAIATRGLAETSLKQTGVISGTASVNATLAKIGLTIDTPESATVTPVIAKETSTASSGDITTTAPSGKYIAVSTAAIEKSTNVMPKVSTAGYGTADVYSATGATVVSGANASGTYYIPLNSGSHSATAADPTIVAATATVATASTATAGFDGNLTAGILSAAPTGEYITITADATPTKGSVTGVVTCTSTEGYIEADQKTATVTGKVEVNVTAAPAKYIRVYGGEVL